MSMAVGAPVRRRAVAVAGRAGRGLCPSAVEELDDLVDRLRAAGCVAAEEEADELRRAARSRAELRALVDRRVDGEPLAWVTGSVQFCGAEVLVHGGVFVPRAQTEALAREASARLPDNGLAVDLCTGSGAVAVALARARPGATVLATEIDPVALACARANGVAVFAGDIAEPLPAGIEGRVDVVTAVVPYVPSSELVFLPRDSAEHEPRRALDGGPDGTVHARRALTAAATLLRPGGSLLFEVGGDQDEILRPVLRAEGFRTIETATDEDGALRALYCLR